MDSSTSNAIREFKEEMNNLNYPPNYEEPKFKLNTEPHYREQVAIADRYLSKYPILNNEEFNLLGHPLYVKRHAEKNLRLDKLVNDRQNCDSVTIMTLSEYKSLLSGDGLDENEANSNGFIEQEITKIEAHAEERGQMSWDNYQAIKFLMSKREEEVN